MARYNEEFKSTTVRKALLPNGPGAFLGCIGRETKGLCPTKQKTQFISVSAL